MKTLHQHIEEKLIINKDYKFIYTPKNVYELHKMVKKIYEESDDYLDARNIDISKLNTFTIDSKTKIRGVFYGLSGIKTIDIRGWDTSNIKDMSFMFCQCHDLEKILGIEDLNVKNCDSLKGMFSQCHSLKTLDLNKWKLKYGVNCSFMFTKCSKLNDLKIDKWDYYNIDYSIGRYDTFKGCQEKIIPDWYED